MAKGPGWVIVVVALAGLALAVAAPQQITPGPSAGRLLPTGCATGQTATFSTTTSRWACATDGGGTVTSASVVTANGVSATTATSTTTPAHTFSLGVIAPTSVTSRHVTNGATPAVSNTGANTCGTTAATIVGNDNAGAVTVGATSGTSCTITFTAAAPTRWQCWVNNETTANLARFIYLTTLTGKFDGTFVAGDVLSYGCLPY